MQWFSTNSDIPQICTGEYEMKRQLGQGLYSKVYEACLNGGDCNYIAKVVPITRTSYQQFEQEVNDTILMSQVGVSPQFKAAWFCYWTRVGGPYDVGILIINKFTLHYGII